MEQLSDTLRLTGDHVEQGEYPLGSRIGISDAWACDGCGHSQPDAAFQTFQEAAEADSDPHSFKRWLLCASCAASIAHREKMPIEWRKARFYGIGGDAQRTPR